MKRILIGASLIVLLTGTAATGASVPLGFRLGYTGDSAKQFHFGGHARILEVTRNVAFQPSIELGLGNDLTVLAGNADLFYEFTELATSDWSFYAGGGVVLSYVSFDAPAGFDGSDTNVGLSIAGGARHVVSEGKRVFAELRFGIEDAPDFKLTAGMTFF